MNKSQVFASSLFGPDLKGIGAIKYISMGFLGRYYRNLMDNCRYIMIGLSFFCFYNTLVNEVVGMAALYSF